MVAFIGMNNNVGKLYDFNIHIYICNLSGMTLCRSKIGVQNLLLKIIGYSIDQVTFFKKEHPLYHNIPLLFLLYIKKLYIYIYICIYVYTYIYIYVYFWAPVHWSIFLSLC